MSHIPDHLLHSTRNFYQALSAGYAKYIAGVAMSEEETPKFISHKRREELSITDWRDGLWGAVATCNLLQAMELKDRMEGDYSAALYHLSGRFPYAYINYPLGYMAAVTEISEADLARKFESVGYTVKNGLLADHPSLAALQSADAGYFDRSEKKQKNFRPGC